MNKEEWKLKYSAFRRLYCGQFKFAIPFNVEYTKCENFNLAIGGAYAFADSLHWSIKEVWFNRPSEFYIEPYKIQQGVKRYQIKCNTYS